MKMNVGSTDRTIRILLGVGILLVGWYFQSWLGLIGIVPILTGTIRWCPAYVPFKMNTCSNAEKTNLT